MEAAGRAADAPAGRNAGPALGGAGNPGLRNSRIFDARLLHPGYGKIDVKEMQYGG